MKNIPLFKKLEEKAQRYIPEQVVKWKKQIMQNQEGQ